MPEGTTFEEQDFVDVVKRHGNDYCKDNMKPHDLKKVLSMML